MNDASFYLNMFCVSIKDMEAVISAAMSCGASYSDLYFENVLYRNMTLKEGKVSSAGCHIEFGVGIRALDGERTGYSFCETTALPDMLKAAAVASKICSSPHSGHLSFNAGTLSKPDFYPVVQNWESVGNESFFSILTTLSKKLETKDNRIVKPMVSISAADDYVMMFNSLGELCFDYRPLYSLHASIVFQNGDGMENSHVSRSFRSGVESVDDSLLDEMVEELVRQIDPLLTAGRPSGGQMSVVMGPGASGILLHEAMGHAFEADFIRKGQSVFSDKMGQKICAGGIDIIDDATWISNRGACNFDDEGVRGQKTYMVKDGVLTSFLHDRISAAYYGVSPTGNGRRESFRFEPVPRMRLTYMDNGNIPPSDIIGSVSKGLYVESFSNGQVKIGEGDFTFYVKLGYLIENGRLTKPVKDINVIGNGPRALSDIAMVGNDLKIENGAWMCGKDQYVPVGCGIPTVLVKSLTVGGLNQGS